MAKREPAKPIRDGTDREVIAYFAQRLKEQGLAFNAAFVPKRFENLVDLELSYWEAEDAAKEAAEKAVTLAPPSAPAPAYFTKKSAKALRAGVQDGFDQINMTFDNVKEATDDLYDRIEKLEAKIVDLEAQRFKYLGTWSQGMAARSGNAVSHDGSLWIAVEKTVAKPGTSNSGWLLACKRGKDGRDAKP